MSQETYNTDRGLERIRTKIEELKKRKSGPLVVGIAGGSGSGKTSKVARQIRVLFPDSAVLSMDDYFLGRQFMENIGSDNWDDPRAIELALVQKHLKSLKLGLPVQKPIYSFKSAERTGYEKFNPCSLLIVEGLYALHETVVDETDLRVFVETSVHGSLLRRILRDIGRTGQTERDIFRQYIETVYPMYKLHIEPTRARADIIIVNQYMPEAEAENCRIREIQIKAILRRKIAAQEFKDLGFKKLGAVTQEDTYYAAPEWDFPYTDELIRIRKEDDRYFLAYKVPVSGTLLRIKPFEIAPSLLGKFQQLGYVKVFFIKKAREVWLGRGVELVIDHIEKGGDFLELRSHNPEEEDRILEYLKELNIDQDLITKKSYLELMIGSEKKLQK